MWYAAFQIPSYAVVSFIHWVYTNCRRLISFFRLNIYPLSSVIIIIIIIIIMYWKLTPCIVTEFVVFP